MIYPEALCTSVLSRDSWKAKWREKREPVPLPERLGLCNATKHDREGRVRHKGPESHLEKDQDQRLWVEPA